MTNSTVTIKLAHSSSQIQTSKSGYKQLIQFYKKCQKYHNRTIHIDFSGLSWLDGNMCALFDAILFKLNTENSLRFGIDVKYIKRHFDILFRNGFLRDLNDIDNYTNSAIELNKFSIDDSDRFIDYISEEFLSHQSLNLAEDVRDNLITCFSEVFSNVELHAETKLPVFACGQYFPQKKRLKFTLLDLGVGYLPNIQEYTKNEITSSKEAINWAITEGHSTKQGTRGGDGLSQILAICKKNKGVLHIVTGDTYWGSDMGIIESSKVPEFTGAMLNITFKC